MHRFSRVNAEAEEHVVETECVEFVKRGHSHPSFVLNIQSYTEWLLHFE